MTRDGAPGPRALLLRDSFATALFPFLAEHFERISFYWLRFGGRQYPLPPELIDEERPDVVIEEWVERDLLFFVPDNRLLPGEGAPRSK